jgi:hypothetical protein
MVTNRPKPPPTPRWSDHDEKPSMRVRVAASMLRHGHDPQEIAQGTGVPLALVELIGEGLDTHPAASPAAPKSVDLAPRSDPTTQRSTATPHGQRPEPAS